MDGKKLIRSIRLHNLLSFGETSGEFALEPLNVLIGPNGSGKSNFLDALAVLASAPRDLAPLAQARSLSDWIWKGEHPAVEAGLDATLFFPHGPMPLRYRLRFAAPDERLELLDEAIENEHPFPGNDKPYLYYAYQDGRPVLNLRTVLPGDEERVERRLQHQDIEVDRSILAQRNDSALYPEVTYVADELSGLRFFRALRFDRDAPARQPQKVDLPGDFLLPDGSNLGLVLNDLLNRPAIRRALQARLQRFNERIEDVTTHLRGGRIQVHVHERGSTTPVSASRLSDGTLSFLCLLSTLLHPEPPAVLCFEEPETGLHPEGIELLVELLVEATPRAQIFVTTHSEELVGALAESVPESVVVCERWDVGTRLRRLSAPRLAEWLDRYRYGEGAAEPEVDESVPHPTVSDR